MSCVPVNKHIDKMGNDGLDSTSGTGGSVRKSPYLSFFCLLTFFSIYFVAIGIERHLCTDLSFIHLKIFQKATLLSVHFDSLDRPLCCTDEAFRCVRAPSIHWKIDVRA